MLGAIAQDWALATAGGTTLLALAALALATLRTRRWKREGEYATLVSCHANDGLVIQDLNGRILWVNEAYCRLMGRPRSEMVGRNPMEFALPPELTPPREEIAAFRYTRGGPYDGRVLRFRNRRGDGTEFWNEIGVSLHRMRDGTERAVLVCRDATEQVGRETALRRAHSEVEFMARHDPMTGLANRSEFLRVARTALDSGGPALGVLHIDIDRFKEINDTVGHAAGDAVICHVADMIAASARGTDLSARLGGDEFVLVCPGIGDLSVLDERAAEIAVRVSRPVDWQGRKIGCSVSIGGALAWPGDITPEEVLVRSDVALYEAKRQGRGRTRLYDEDLHARHVLQQTKTDQLRRAIGERRLAFSFQPTVDLATGEVRGFETLVRWPSGEGRELAPGAFLHLARDLGLMAEIDFAAMEAAIRMHVRLFEATGRRMVLAFNASPELLVHRHFFTRLSRRLAQDGIDPRYIAIEVIETVLFGPGDDPGPYPGIVLDLCQMGFSVLLDDFGTGYAGLGHLATLPVTGVKLDRSLIAGFERDATRREIIRALHSLSERIGVTMVAEGIETGTTAVELGRIGPFVAQGYWIAPPIPEAEVLAWLEGRTIAGDAPPPGRDRRLRHLAAEAGESADRRAGTG
ncbi:putative bifunctional diguanylate cyclase/phosphodiesterase [Wenxinia saemankumensis]|uniref:Diguanylate cyclase/phosphodiesterase with PAS/PAC sensor(S) n=1 Tax=Wenxinia saemankumensis TaxID=1447782 RepID=A0A1M6EW96_9RHOB|nr:EAL domain-containing protein [Wenxinia saemankumensis]SHI89725.1 diguanylate cyclase/phosphodiesterase with PAS/PAC sensor(s) [Wenxinia saemankumensis]